LRNFSAARFLPFVALALPLLSGCAARAGRVYHIEEETVEARFAAGPPARLDVRARWKLRNVGDQPLPSLEVELPSVQAGGRENLVAQVNGRKVAPRGGADARAGRISVPLAPRWKPKHTLALSLDYQLALPEAPQSDVSAFYFGASDWFPDLAFPPGHFARGRERARDVRMTVVVPQGFRILSTGRPQGSRQRGAEVEHRLLLRRRDAEPFLLAGRYVETAFAASSNAIVFWSFDPLAPADAQRAALRLADTTKTYERSFGEPAGVTLPFHLAESDLPVVSGSFGHRAVSFPGGVLVGRGALAQDEADESFLELVEGQLAATWFEQIIHLRREASLVLGDGAARYATIVAAEAREGEAARQHRAASLLHEYDEARAKAVEKPLASLQPADPAPQLELARAKAPLFFLALEERCGKENVRRALAHLLGSLRGQEVGFAELRSALEEECRADLAEFFRTWLNQTGIPADFRSRYASNPSTP
jgi:hypothetical protein